MIQPIKVIYQSTNNVYQANQFLLALKQRQLLACDFEAAVKYSAEEREAMQAELDSEPTRLRAIDLQASLAATALDHPSRVQLTHLSVAWSPSEAYVFILDNPKITKLVLQFLVTTPIRQIWHNATFDFKHIYYHTKRMPINYEDTQILAKTILNHVDTSKAKTGLKELAGKWYGAWGISADYFDLTEMYNPDVLLYAATDSCATFKLWESINAYLHPQIDLIS